MLETWLAGIGAKLIAVGLALALIFGAFWYVKSLTDDVAKAKAEAAVLKVERDSARSELELTNKRIEDAKKFVDILNTELQAARNDRKAMVEVFAEHDFGKLVSAKPGLITTRMRRATERVWADFEALSEPMPTSKDGVSERAER